MKTSERGIALLTYLEGFREDVYLDQAGLPTIGFGHLLSPRERATDAFRYGVSKRGGRLLLEEDLAWAEKTVEEEVKTDLSQNEFDALSSFVFNIGKAGFARSTALARLNNGDRKGAAEAMRWWNKVRSGTKKVVSDGLAHRREMEIALFLDGDYGV